MLITHVLVISNSSSSVQTLKTRAPAYEFECAQEHWVLNCFFFIFTRALITPIGLQFVRLRKGMSFLSFDWVKILLSDSHQTVLLNGKSDQVQARVVSKGPLCAYQWMDFLKPWKIRYSKKLRLTYRKRRSKLQSAIMSLTLQSRLVDWLHVGSWGEFLYVARWPWFPFVSTSWHFSPPASPAPDAEDIFFSICIWFLLLYSTATFCRASIFLND